MPKKPNKKQRLTFEFLQEKERKDETFSEKELSEASTYPLNSSLKAKLSRNEFGEFIEEVRKDQYKAKNTLGITVEDYARRVSSKHRQGQGMRTHLFSFRLAEKSIQAALSALEIYNKPDFKYREESFSILMVNAWELLLKAKIIQDNSETHDAIYEKEKGEYKTSRSGNPMTIGLPKAIQKLGLPKELTGNLDTLLEIRDNCTHLIDTSQFLQKKVLEVGTASLKSYVSMVNKWFDHDLSKYNFFIMPMSFFHEFEMESFSINKEDKQFQNLLRYIGEKEKAFESDQVKEHNITLILDTKWTRSKSVEALTVKGDPNDPNAISVKLDTEDEFQKKFPWTYRDHLKPKLKKLYSDFKQTKYFWELLNKLKEDENLYKLKLLDPNNPNSGKKGFFSPNILKEFDKHYTKKKKS